MAKKLSNKAKVKKIKEIIDNDIPNGTIYDLPLILKKIVGIIYDIENNQEIINKK